MKCECITTFDSQLLTTALAIAVNETERVIKQSLMRQEKAVAQTTKDTIGSNIALLEIEIAGYESLLDALKSMPICGRE